MPATTRAKWQARARRAVSGQKSAEGEVSVTKGLLKSFSKDCKMRKEMLRWARSCEKWSRHRAGKRIAEQKKLCSVPLLAMDVLRYWRWVYSEFSRGMVGCVEGL